MTYSTAALVGATGGAGTTRTTLEMAVVLAATDADVAVLDAAYATQGLGDYLAGRLDPDITALVTDRTETPLSAGIVELDWGKETERPGRVVCCPAAAPFERLARAKSVEAAQAFERRIEEAAADFDHVLVDVPPVAANQAVAAVTACERVGVVTPGDDRGADALGRLRARLTDVGTEADVVVTTGGTDERAVADVVLPQTERSFPAAARSESYAERLGDAAAALFDREVTVEPRSDGLLKGVSDRVRRT